MQHFSNFITKFIHLFPLPWPTIWVWFMLANIVLGFLIPDSHILTFLRLSSIFLCLVYTRQIFREDLLLQLALLATFLSDIILALDNVSEIGLICFLATQIIHTIRLNWRQLKLPIIILSLAAFLAILLNSFLSLTLNIYIICFFYVIFLITNLLVSWRWHVREPRNPRAGFALSGFFLFLCCDICTGVSYLALNSAAPFFLYFPANFLAWFFYYPSQILISNSSTGNYPTTLSKYATMLPKGR